MLQGRLIEVTFANIISYEDIFEHYSKVNESEMLTLSTIQSQSMLQQHVMTTGSL